MRVFAFPGAYEFYYLPMPGIGSLFVFLFLPVVLFVDYFWFINSLYCPSVFLPPLCFRVRFYVPLCVLSFILVC